MPLAIVLAALLALAVSCSETATSPTTPGGTGPVIREIQPGSIQAGSQPQTITVTGDNFATGLSLTVTKPDNQTITISQADIDSLTTNSFRTSVVFDLLGPYGFVARSASGTSSPNFTVAVQVTNSPPQLISVSPAATPQSTIPQPIIIQGQALSAPLSVTITDPDGFATVIGNDSLNVTSTSVSLTFVPSKRGAWSLYVTLPGGISSNAVVLSVG